MSEHERSERYIIKENGDIIPIDLRLNEKAIKELLKAEEIQWFEFGHERSEKDSIMYVNTETDDYQENKLATKLFNQPHIIILGAVYITSIDDIK